MLAYSQLIIQEALHHGGPSWIEYDRVFHRQLAIKPSLAWNILEPSLQAATILGQRTGNRPYVLTDKRVTTLQTSVH